MTILFAAIAILGSKNISNYLRSQGFEWKNTDRTKVLIVLGYHSRKTVFLFDRHSKDFDAIY